MRSPNSAAFRHLRQGAQNGFLCVIDILQGRQKEVVEFFLGHGHSSACLRLGNKGARLRFPAPGSRQNCRLLTALERYIPELRPARVAISCGAAALRPGSITRHCRQMVRDKGGNRGGRDDRPVNTVLFHQPPTIPSPRGSAYGLSVHVGGLMRINLTACERVKMCWGTPRAAPQPPGNTGTFRHATIVSRDQEWGAGARGFEPPYGAIKICCLTLSIARRRRET